jgi:hypothetical protein
LSAAGGELVACRGCGCTDDQACVWFEVLGDGRTIERRCTWAAPGVCSECVDVAGVDQGAAEPLLYDAYGVPVQLAPAPARGAR